MVTHTQVPEERSRIEYLLGYIIGLAPGLAWNFDPAHSGHRFRAFPPGPFALTVYLDGTWYLDRDGKTIAQGHDVPSFETGVRECWIMWRHRRDGVILPGVLQLR